MATSNSLVNGRQAMKDYYFNTYTERKTYRKNPDGTTTVVVEREPRDPGQPAIEPVRPLTPVERVQQQPQSQMMMIETSPRSDYALVYFNPIYRDY